MNSATNKIIRSREVKSVYYHLDAKVNENSSKKKTRFSSCLPITLKNRKLFKSLVQFNIIESKILTIGLHGGRKS